MIVVFDNKIRSLLVLTFINVAVVFSIFPKPSLAQEAITSQLELQLDFSEENKPEQIALLLEFSEALLYVNPADAKGFAQSALELSEETANLDYLIESHRIIGLAEIYQGFVENAFHHLSEAMELAQRSTDRPVISNIHRAMGRFYQYVYNEEAAKDHFITALDIAEQYDLLRQTGLAYNAMGDLLLRAGQLDDAMSYYKSAMDILTVGNLVYLRSWPKASYGQALYRQGRYEEALTVLTEVADESFNAGIWNAYGGAMIYKAQTQAALGQLDEAIDTYNLVLANELSRRYSTDLSVSYLGLSEIYLAKNDPKQALQVLNIGVYELGSLNLLNQEMALVRKIIEIHHKLGNLEAAKTQTGRYFDLADQYQLDQVFELSQSLKAERAIRNYEQALSQKQLELNQQENRLVLVSAALLVALLAVIILVLLVRGRGQRVKVIGREKREIEAVSEQRARLLKVIGDDLRSSLRKIVATFGGLANVKSAQFGQNLASAQMASQVALIATNNVNELANLEAGQSQERTEVFIPAIEIDEMLDFWRIWAEENNVTFQLSLSKNLYQEVSGPLRAMEMILVNILSIIIKQMSSGTIKIMAGLLLNEKAQSLQIMVDYDGVIDHHYDLAIFQEMARAKKLDLNQMNDIGIGLMVCLYLAKQIDADIGVDVDNADKGRFWVSLPIDVTPSEV